MTDPSGQGYVAAFSLALKGVETIKNMVTSADAKRQAAELFEIILAGQRSALEESVKQRALLETVRDLEEKLRRSETWETEKLRYSLAQPFSGSAVYALKKSTANGEPPHYLCANCYTDGKKSILNLVPSNSHSTFACRCGSQVVTPYRGSIPFQYAEDITTS